MIVAVLGVLAGTAHGSDGELEVGLHGDVKTFGTVVLPYDHLIQPADPGGQGTWDLRLKGSARYGDRLRAEVHHAVTAVYGSSGLEALGFVDTGVGAGNTELVDLSWEAPIDGNGLTVGGRTDWAYLGVSGPGVDATIGRQPIHFGSGMFFTPLDLVNPTTPTTIDTEYKRGVDALRVDGYFGTSGKVTAVAAWAGDWNADGMVFAAQGSGTVGTSDLGGFLGLVHGEPVLGASVVTGVGAVGLHSDVALTLPQDDDAFVRAVVGTLLRPTQTTTVTAEAYLQTFGATDPQEYLVVALDDRFARGEVWNWGRYYSGVSVAQEISPLVNGSVAWITNLADPSALLAPGLDWSIAENASLGVGGFVGIGPRPAEVNPADLVDPNTGLPLPERQLVRQLGIQSEFGTYPGLLFAELKAYW